MKKIIILALILFSCTLLNGYRDFSLRSLSDFDFAIGKIATWQGEYYVIIADTPSGQCRTYIPVEMVHLHLRDIEFSPFIRVASDCGNEEYNFKLCGLKNKSGCYEYHIYLPRDTIVKRLDCESFI